MTLSKMHCITHGRLLHRHIRRIEGSPACLVCFESGHVVYLTGKDRPKRKPKKTKRQKHTKHVHRRDRDPVRFPSSALRSAVYRRDGHKCLDCGSAEALTCDHIVPHSHGGTTDLSNLQTLCRDCNMRKGESHDDFRKQESPL